MGLHPCGSVVLVREICSVYVPQSVSVMPTRTNCFDNNIFGSSDSSWHLVQRIMKLRMPRGIIPIHPIYRLCHSSMHILQGIWGLCPNIVLFREIWSCLCASVGYVYNSTSHFDKSILRTIEWPWQPYTLVCTDIYTLWGLYPVAAFLILCTS